MMSGPSSGRIGGTPVSAATFVLALMIPFRAKELLLRDAPIPPDRLEEHRGHGNQVSAISGIAVVAGGTRRKTEECNVFWNARGTAVERRQTMLG